MDTRTFDVVLGAIFIEEFGTNRRDGLYGTDGGGVERVEQQRESSCR